MGDTTTNQIVLEKMAVGQHALKEALISLQTAENLSLLASAATKAEMELTNTKNL